MRLNFAQSFKIKLKTTPDLGGKLCEKEINLKKFKIKNFIWYKNKSIIYL